MPFDNPADATTLEKMLAHLIDQNIERLAMTLFDRALDKNQRSITDIGKKKAAFIAMPTWLEAGIPVRDQYRKAAAELLAEYP